MVPFVLVSLIICLSVGLILHSTIICLHIGNHLKAGSYFSDDDYCWEKTAEVVVSVGLIGLGITGFVAIANTPRPTQEMYHWLDAVILARLLQIFISPRWAIWMVHLVALLTILDIVSAVTSKTVSSAYNSSLLARLAAASLLSWALSRKQVETYKNSGSVRRDEEYARFLYAALFTNAFAASFQLCSASFVSTLSLAGRNTSTQLRQGLFILLCHLPFYVNRIWRLRRVLPTG
uniref:Uncharacterized protein ORF26 n=1 Tax=Alternaria alternata TaxID=5599 RepID=C9K7I8_ALTAL|nr:hypothetical protein [Alternaria alternata]